MVLHQPYPDSWHRHAFWAMGSEMAVWLETTDLHTATTALAQVGALFAANEQALSRFRLDSELSQVNARSGQWVAVSDLLWDVLTLALQMAAMTAGRFDPTMLNALEQSGYTVSFEQLASIDSNDQPPTMMSFPGQWAAIELDGVRQAVYLPEGVRLDLDGIAKGYTAQQAVDRLRTLGPCLVDAGGDLVAGAAPQAYPGWPVAVTTPWTGNETQPADLCTLWLADGALATSGIDYRTWQWHGRSSHHLIDPATGHPTATDGLTVTILVEDAVQAEAWATATLVAGSRAGMETLLAGSSIRRDACPGATL